MKKLSQIVACSALLAAVMVSPASAAGSATLSLSPTSGSYAQGASFNVTVTETGDNVNVVTAKLTYDASKLTCNSVSGGAAFGGNVSTTCGGGSVTISRYVEAGSPAVNGSQVVGTVNFTAISNSGSATVSTAAGSQIASGGSNVWNGATTSASFTLTAPATTGGQGGVGTPTSSGSTAPKATAPKSTAKAATSNTAKTATPAVAGEATKPAESTTPAAAPAPSTPAPTASTPATETTATTAPKSNAPTWVSGIAVAAAVGGAGYLAAKRNPSLVEKAKSMIPSKGKN